MLVFFDSVQSWKTKWHKLSDKSDGKRRNEAAKDGNAIPPTYPDNQSHQSPNSDNQSQQRSRDHVTGRCACVKYVQKNPLILLQSSTMKTDVRALFSVIRRIICDRTSSRMTESI